ncbi:MAG: HEAT repeat domain-containing protein, partial [Pollutimonas bauzanensis]
MSLTAILNFWRRAVLVMLMLTLAPCALAAETANIDAALLAPLADGDTGAKLQAISQLGQLPHPMAAQILEALASENLYATPGGRILILLGDKRAMDPVAGEQLDLPADADSIVINNRLRRAITGALAVSQLFSENPQVRLAAARRLQQSGDASTVALIAQALAKETNPDVRAALEIAHASLELKSPDPALRKHAAEALGNTNNGAFRPILAGMLARDAGGAYTEPDEAVRAAATAALKRIDRHLSTIEWAGNLFYGISLGSVL